MLTVGKLKELIKDMPDSVLVLQNDPFSEFSHNISDAERGFAELDHTAIDGKNYYNCWDEDTFKDFLEDNPEDIEEIKQEFQQVLLLDLD